MTLRIEAIAKRYEGGGGLGPLSLDLAGGELLALLGPSGCGKSTLLRLVSGLIPPDQGRVTIDGRDVTLDPPDRREIGFVFQNYALFPHLDVGRNVAYGLRARGVREPGASERVARALTLVDLPEAARRRVDQLSGGEQQRVALARAIVTEPKVLLLDEPLSNLDTALRRSVREQLRAVQQKLGIPAIHVTHDQEEALAIADRIAVLEAGKLRQIGPPEEVFQRPANRFVARFLGRANVVSARVLSRTGESVTVEILGVRATVGAAATGRGSGDVLDAAIRPDDLTLHPSAENGALSIPAEVLTRTYLGDAVELLCQAGSETLALRVSRRDAGAAGTTGTRVMLTLPRSAIHLMPREDDAR